MPRNQSDKKTILIIAPYWRHARHVGNHRIDRYSRWLFEAGYNIVIVRAGSSDRVETTKLGYEITIWDPLNLYPEAEKNQSATGSKRKPNRFRRMLAYLLLNPDPSIIWVRRVVKHRLVREYSTNVACLLSSSPPESIHIGSSQIARRLGARLFVDMRDGWLDEPLKPLLQQSGLRRWREGMLEKRILKQAEKIIVTSDPWKEMLDRRLVFTKDKTVVVTNGYPLRRSQEATEKDPVSTDGGTRSRTIRLVHTGRFTASSNARKPGYLLKLLEGPVGRHGIPGVITLLGDLNSEDRTDIERWSNSFRDKGWVLEIERSVSREQMFDVLRDADGLLLLSVSKGAIPSKLFEYIAVQKPILAVTGQASAVGRMGEVPQMFLADYQAPQESAEAVSRFLEACITRQYTASVPDVYTEKYLKSIFIKKVMRETGAGERGGDRPHLGNDVDRGKTAAH